MPNKGKKAPVPLSERFKCPYPGCKRSFAELWRLKVHYRASPDVRGSGKERGHGQELLQCPQCGAKLTPGKHHIQCTGSRSRRAEVAKKAQQQQDDGGLHRGPSTDPNMSSGYGTETTCNMMHVAVPEKMYGAVGSAHAPDSKWMHASPSVQPQSMPYPTSDVGHHADSTGPWYQNGFVQQPGPALGPSRAGPHAPLQSPYILLQGYCNTIVTEGVANKPEARHCSLQTDLNAFVWPLDQPFPIAALPHAAERGHHPHHHAHPQHHAPGLAPLPSQPGHPASQSASHLRPASAYPQQHTYHPQQHQPQQPPQCQWGSTNGAVQRSNGVAPSPSPPPSAHVHVPTSSGPGMHGHTHARHHTHHHTHTTPASSAPRSALPAVPSEHFMPPSEPPPDLAEMLFDFDRLDESASLSFPIENDDISDLDMDAIMSLGADFGNHGDGKGVVKIYSHDPMEGYRTVTTHIHRVPEPSLGSADVMDLSAGMAPSSAGPAASASSPGQQECLSSDMDRPAKIARVSSTVAPTLQDVAQSSTFVPGPMHYAASGAPHDDRAAPGVVSSCTQEASMRRVDDLPSLKAEEFAELISVAQMSTCAPKVAHVKAEASR